jgi:hypothetical protein
MLSIDALGAHHTQHQKKSAAAREQKDIVLFIYSAPSVFLKRGFLSLREMQIVNTGLPAAGIWTKAFFEKKYNVGAPSLLSYCREGIHFQSAAEEKSGTGREFSPAASEFTYSINALAPSVYAIGCLRRGMLLMCDAHRLVC